MGIGCDIRLVRICGDGSCFRNRFRRNAKEGFHALSLYSPPGGAEQNENAGGIKRMQRPSGLEWLLFSGMEVRRCHPSSKTSWNLRCEGSFSK